MGDAKLIVDTFFMEPTEYEFTPGKIVESKGGTKLHILGQMAGRFGWVDEPTGNKRVYPMKVMDPNLDRLKPHIESRGVYGELDHPLDGMTRASRVSHIITSLVRESKELKGSWDILDTPNGRIMMSICKAEGRLGTSSRGSGTTTPGPKGEEVNADYVLRTFDAVLDPAAKGAYPKLVAEAQDLQQLEDMVISYETLKKDFPGLHEEVLSMVLEEHKEQTQVQVPEGFEGFEGVVEKVREEFQGKLEAQKGDLELVVIDLLGGFRDEVAEEEKARLLKTLDPVLDRTALEEISTVLARRGILVPEEYDNQISDLKEALKEAQERASKGDISLAELKETNAILSKLGIQTSCLLMAEKKLSGASYRQAVIDVLGDPARYENKEEFEKALDSAIQEFSSKDKETTDLRTKAEKDQAEQESQESQRKVADAEKKLGEAESAHQKEIEDLKSKHEVESGELKADAGKWQTKYEDAHEKNTKIAEKYSELFEDAKRVEREALEDEKRYEGEIESLRERNEKLKSQVEEAELKVKVERMLSARPDADKLRPMVENVKSVEEAAEIIKSAVQGQKPSSGVREGQDAPAPRSEPKGVQNVAEETSGDEDRPPEAEMAYQEEMSALGIEGDELTPRVGTLEE